jgi:tRNA A37 threonylcarbamoyladenosine synthetase subunit TsaC/SUA5/YrdC
MSTRSSAILQLTDAAARAEAADALVAGEIIVSAYNGIFVLLGDADDPLVPEKIAAAKKRPRAKGVALVCPPEFLAEHVELDAPVLQATYPFEQIEALFRALHALGVILPAASPGAPPHVVQAGTILNVWTEQPPSSPLRQLVLEVRRHGRRALVGTSANHTGRPTITDADEVQLAFAGRVPMMLLDDVARVPPGRRRSASIVDLTGPVPRLVREGSVSAEELRAELRLRELGQLRVGPEVTRV